MFSSLDRNKVQEYLEIVKDEVVVLYNRIYTTKSSLVFCWWGVFIYIFFLLMNPVSSLLSHHNFSYLYLLHREYYLTLSLIL